MKLGLIQASSVIFLLNISQFCHAEVWSRAIENDSDFPVTLSNTDNDASWNYIDNADYSDAHNHSSDFNGNRSSSPLGLIVAPHTTIRTYVITSQSDKAVYAINSGGAVCFTNLYRASGTIDLNMFSVSNFHGTFFMCNNYFGRNASCNKDNDAGYITCINR